VTHKSKPAHPELVEGLSCFWAKEKVERQGFDKLSLIGFDL
jgi:hypothetical protein